MAEKRYLSIRYYTQKLHNTSPDVEIRDEEKLECLSGLSMSTRNEYLTVEYLEDTVELIVHIHNRAIKSDPNGPRVKQLQDRIALLREVRSEVESLAETLVTRGFWR